VLVDDQLSTLRVGAILDTSKFAIGAGQRPLARMIRHDGVARSIMSLEFMALFLDYFFFDSSLI
jgi:hypothetical protein